MHKHEPIPPLSGIKTIIFDFDGIFTNNKVYLNEEGIESIQCDRGDGLGINILKRFIKKSNLDIDIFILSKEKNQVVQKRAAKLEIKCLSGVDDKLSLISNYFLEKNGEIENSFKTLLYVGNDLNDLKPILKSGFSVCPNDSHPIIKKYSMITLKKNGGDGFVRELIELLLKLNDLEIDEISDLI